MTRLSDATTFQPTEFVDRILTAPEHPIRASGIAPRTLIVAQDELGRAAAARGLDLVLVDCATSEHALATAIRARLQELQVQRRVDGAILRLAEAVDRSDEPSAYARTEGLARLWRALTDAHPALLLIVNSRAASDDDAALIDYFVRHVYSDPVGAIVPQQRAWLPPAGRMVVTDYPDSKLFDDLDFGADAESAVRAYLATDEVVRRFMASTEGDISRLDELVGELPENASHLALFRYQRLPVTERAIVDVLAVAAQPLAPEHLHDAVALLEASEYFARSLRHLEDAGILRRAMGQGRIVIALDDAGFGAALLEQIDDARLSDLHRAIADAERARHPDQPDAALLATHYAAAGDLELARQYRSGALARLRRERRFPAARRLIETMLAGARAEHRDELEVELASLLEDMGDYQAALDACARVEAESAPLFLRKGRLSARVGHWADAKSAYQAVVDADADGLRRDALLGLADAEYSLGDHDAAVAHLEALIARLAEDVAPAVRDRALTSARNTLGKIAIVRSQFAAAIDHFEANRDLATRWGWDDEVARAQANLGVVALQRDDHVEALERLTAALEASDTRGSLPRAYCLMNLATVYQRRDAYEPALEYCLEAMRCAKMVGDRNAYAVATRNLATIYQDMGDYVRAMTLLDHLRDSYEADEQSLGGGWNLLVRGQLELDTDEFEAAEQTFEQLRSARLKPVFGPVAAIRLAEIQFELGHEVRAEELLVDAELGERPLYHGLAGLLKARMTVEHDAAKALEIGRVAWETLDEVGQKNDTVRARLAIADALTSLGRETEARTELQRELGRIRDVADTIPEEFKDYFWKKPVNRALVERLQELNGEVPTSCVVAEEPVAAPAPPTRERTPEYMAWRGRYEDIVGEDEKLLQVFRLIDKVANSDATVLAYGESGTGKELVASAMHAHSDRRGKPFVKVNCGAFVENLLLSELFGHEKGAFTGATERKLGRFERAQGGTIFLDEIGDISPNTQVALLRVLQEGTFERVGGTETIETDVRVVCATNKDLESMVRRGEFRLDLYYRLKGVVIEMPALRERRGDIALLANHFARTLAADGPKEFSGDALQFLSRYSWPGNVRELQNFVRSIVLFVESRIIDKAAILEFRDFFVSGEIDETLPEVELPQSVQVKAAPVAEETSEETTVVYAGQTPEEALIEQIVSEGRSLSDIKKRLEMECIKRALITTGGNVTQAADILQMKRPRLSQIINGDEELSALKARLAG